MHLIICKLFVITEIVAKEVCLNNHFKQQITCRSNFYSLSSTLFFIILLAKPPICSSLHRFKYRSSPLSKWWERYTHFLCAYGTSYGVGCRKMENSARKVSVEVCGNLLHLEFNSEKKLAFYSWFHVHSTCAYGMNHSIQLSRETEALWTCRLHYISPWNQLTYYECFYRMWLFQNCWFCPIHSTCFSLLFHHWCNNAHHYLKSVMTVLS